MSSVRYRSGEGELIPVIVLIIINIVVYLAINLAAFSGGSIVQYLALSRSTVMTEPWTILTSMFTHMDFMHLLANMVTLYFYGSFLNRITGTRTFLWIYFGGGLLSALAVLLLSNPMAYTIGASGAIFALGGALAVLIPMLKVFIFPIPVPMPLWVAILIGFLILAFIPGVSWQGHLGGLLFGLAAGWYLRGRLRPVPY
ncbi:MAG: rhomboid family intramembrane serine protease [Chloroflexi bacterium]|nr:rhomboid family intramembrane serine protease [Chloroflexota bacterium]